MKIQNQVRDQFKNFFKNNGHEVLPSSSLVPEDSTLLFTNSGMVQFKEYFAGKLESPHVRVSTVQKCVRAGGKHNDLDNVGYTNRHHTFFEMLGNFSFGNYFKEEAIAFAWNFLTKEIGIDKSRLYVTIYHIDDEAYNIWKKHVAEDRIIRISTSDNFWQVGNVGPCGPCSEIFYDYGPKVAGGLPGSPEQDGARFTEIWNLVFMQNFIHEDGNITKLSKQNIDTGMGLERLISVLEGTVDNYSTTPFKELINSIASVTKIKPSENLFTAGGNVELFSQNDIALRILADHIRSSAFLIADGILPSNEGRGYVLRRIIRRLLKSAYFAGMKEQFLAKIADELISQMGGEYSELVRARGLILSQMQSEEEKFMELLPRGVKVLQEGIAQNSKAGLLSGTFAFKLYDTYGFPLDITLEIAKKHGVNSIDEKAFESEMNTQQERSKKSWKGTHKDDMEVLKKEISSLPKTEFLGYDATSCKATVLYSKNGYMVFDKTVFYAESGGQISDIGTADYADVFDVQNIDGIFVHYASENIPCGEVSLQVNEARRRKIAANHTATHLLHHILRRKYGEALVQKGSLVKDDGFRFDFSHSKPISLAEIHEIEIEVNAVIAQNNATNIEHCSQEEAQGKGAMALFGEKYGNVVRVVSTGLSVELCGGIHAKSTGEIGFFKIISQGSVASGVRRIEAVTGIDAVRCAQSFESEAHDIKAKFKTSSSVMELVQQKDDEIKTLKQQNHELGFKVALQNKNHTIGKVTIKFLENSYVDLRQVASAMAGDVRAVFNQKGEAFSFCLLASIDAKIHATSLLDALKLQAKFGGNDGFVSGGGVGVVDASKLN